MNKLFLKKYKIKDFNLFCKSNYGVLYKATSEIYGPVIIKANKDSENYKNSCKYYNMFNNLPLCKMYAHYDKEQIQVLEFINGNKLFDIKEFNLRLRISYNYLKKWSNNLNQVEDETMLFEHKVSHIIKRINEIDLEDNIIELIDSFESMSKHFFENYNNLYLIHGDLHHDNMIYDGNDITAIDLSPEIASFAIEVAKFIENELFMDVDNINRILDKILEVFKFDIINEKELLEGLFIDSCYRTFDSLFENGKNNDFEKGIYMNKCILNYIKSR